MNDNIQKWKFIGKDEVLTLYTKDNHMESIDKVYDLCFDVMNMQWVAKTSIVWSTREDRGSVNDTYTYDDIYGRYDLPE